MVVVFYLKGYADMSKPATSQEDHLKSRLEFHQDLLKEKDAHINELNNAIVNLRDKNDTLQRERDGWKRAGKREGIYGFCLGMLIFFWVGYLVAATLIR